MDNNKKSLKEMTVKEAIAYDVAEISFRSSVLVDPAPMPFIPITPIVAGKQVLNGVKKASAALKNRMTKLF